MVRIFDMYYSDEFGCVPLLCVLLLCAFPERGPTGVRLWCWSMISEALIWSRKEEALVLLSTLLLCCCKELMSESVLPCPPADRSRELSRVEEGFSLGVF